MDWSHFDLCSVSLFIEVSLRSIFLNFAPSSPNMRTELRSTPARLVCVNLALLKPARATTASVKLADVRFAPSNCASVRSAPSKSAFSRSAWLKFAESSFAYVRSAPSKSASISFAWLRSADPRIAFSRSEKLRSAQDRFEYKRLTPFIFESLKLTELKS